jgi:hypothetical protein
VFEFIEREKVAFEVAEQETADPPDGAEPLLTTQLWSPASRKA